MSAGYLLNYSIMKLLNRKKVKQAALEVAQILRPEAKFSRVSAGFLDALEAEMAAMIRNRVHRNPSVGVTLK